MKNKILLTAALLGIGLVFNSQKVFADTNRTGSDQINSSQVVQNPQNQNSDQTNQQTGSTNNNTSANINTTTNSNKTTPTKIKTGVQNIGKNSYGYFDQNGKQKFSNTKTAKAYYWINKKGQITGVKNYAKVISQRPDMPTGCEITAVTMMVNFAGKKVTKNQAAKVMHYSKNPNKGFIGSPYKEWPEGYWVAPDGIKSVVKHYLGKSEVMTGKSMNAVKNKLLHSHLVVLWVGAFDGFPNHAITLTGYHNGKIYYNDPWTGTKRTIKESTLKYHWKLNKYRALSY